MPPTGLGLLLGALRWLALVGLALLLLSGGYAGVVSLAGRRLWRADEAVLRAYYQRLGAYTDVVPADARRNTYHLFRRNCAAFPAWLFPRGLNCHGTLGQYMHPWHCRLEAPAAAGAAVPSAAALVLDWLALAPQLPALDVPAPGLDVELAAFLERAVARRQDVRVILAAVWIAPLYYLTQHLTALLVAGGRRLSLGIDTAGHAPFHLLFARDVPFRLRSPDTPLLRSRYRHCAVRSDYAMPPAESAEVLRRLRTEWRPHGA